MKVMILCGGMGMRIRDVSDAVPKPMVEVGGRPILWHVMKTYSHYGYDDFILCLGFKQNVIKEYFINYKLQHADLTVNTMTGDTTFKHVSSNENWNVTMVDTGLLTMTAARVKRAMKYVDTDTMMLTYADGLSDIDISELVRFHNNQKALGTITAVHPAGRFGELDLSGDKITGFNEKPQVTEGYINGGFMVLDREFISRYVTDDPEMPLEQAPLRNAAHNGDLTAFRFNGWWQCMDTMREYKLLNKLWKENNAPWKSWA